MYRYPVHGGVLATSVPLVELHEMSATDRSAPTWELLQTDAPAPDLRDSILVGEEDIAYGAVVRLFRAGGDKYRVSYTDTGIFDFTNGGRSILWYRPQGVHEELARMDIVGRVLAFASHLIGDIVLHASGVQLEGGAVGFMGPKFCGKTTLATAITYEGANLVTDDALAIKLGARVQCAPGVPSLRLRHPSARHFERTRDRAKDDPREQRVIDMLPPERIAQGPVDLAALYLLNPPGAEEAGIVHRVPLDPVEGAISLVRFSKLGGMLGKSEAAAYFNRAISLCTAVPMYALVYPHDLSQLSDVARTVVNWHRAPAAH